MTRNGFPVARLRVLPKCVLFTFPAQHAAVSGEDAAGVPQASSDYDEFLLSVSRQGAQGLLAPVLQDEGNRLAKVRQAFFTRVPLTIGPGHFGAVRDVVFAVSLDNRRELIVHESILPPPADSISAAETALVRHLAA